jgi:hypothetical protein
MTGLSAAFALVILSVSPSSLAPAPVARSPLETGSLVFLEHSNPLVATWTKSDITHVAIVVRQEDVTWIYEATPGHVRRVALEQYLDELARMNHKRRRPIRAWSMPPRDDWEEQTRAALVSYLDSQLGRRYSVRNYVRGKKGDGVHCAELASAALEQTGRFQLHPHFAQHPGRLVAALDSDYLEPAELALPMIDDEPSWCSRTWRRWSSFGNWCRWSCYETWTFCW